MLVNLINTILIACGMAVNTTNFNSVEKPYRRNANTIQNLVDTNAFYTAQYNIDPNNSSTSTYKYYLRNTNIGGQTATANFYNENVNIYNTEYRFNTINTLTTNQSIAEIVAVFQIDNYMDISLADIIMNFNLVLTTNTYTNTQRTYFTQRIYTSYEEEFTEYIDQTITTPYFGHNLYNELYSTNKGTLIRDRQSEHLVEAAWTQENSTNYRANVESLVNINYLAAHSNIQIVFIMKVANNASGYTNDAFYRFDLDDTRYNRFRINGYTQEIVRNYDVIDIPGIMLTVLTLPFSFISQAFDLTIFPGTPYALNFSNLFRTIVAIFVLLWIIKKIFK